MKEKPRTKQRRKARPMLAWVVILAASIVFVIAQAPVPTNKPAVYPAWWFEREVIERKDTNVQNPQWPTNYLTSDDYATINAGQLKSLATRAYEELQERLPVSLWEGESNAPGPKLINLISIWSTNTSSGDNFAIVNHGQLKAIAKPFYDVLAQAGYVAGHGLEPTTWTNGAYPWSLSTNMPDAYAAANIGQAKYLFSFDITKFDSDGDGLPDEWENEHLGNTGFSASDDADADGLTNQEEYQQGTDPKDFYNGEAAVLEIVDGNNQGDFPGMTLARPFIVKLTNHIGVEKSDATVTFEIRFGGGELTPLNGGITDTQGLARASLKLSTKVGEVISVEARSGDVRVSFVASVGDASKHPQAPGKPSIIQEHGATTALIEWEDRSNNETGFYVERTKNGRDWLLLQPEGAPLGKNTTTFTDTNLIPDEVHFYRVLSCNAASP